MSAYFSAFIVGIAVAAPIGPVGMLCAQRTLAGGTRLGIASGLGVATADAVYASVAAAGIVAVSSAASAAAGPLRIAGGLMLVVLAYRALRTRDYRQGVGADVSGRGLAAAYLSAMGLTLANPATIAAFAGILAGLGAGVADPGSGPVFVAGIASGSLAWWVVLALVVGAARTRVPRRVVRGASVVSAGVLGVAGVIALISGVTTYV